MTTRASRGRRTRRPTGAERRPEAHAAGAGEHLAHGVAQPAPPRPPAAVGRLLDERLADLRRHLLLGHQLGQREAGQAERHDLRRRHGLLAAVARGDQQGAEHRGPARAERRVVAGPTGLPSKADIRGLLPGGRPGLPPVVANSAPFAAKRFNPEHASWAQWGMQVLSSPARRAEAARPRPPGRFCGRRRSGTLVPKPPRRPSTQIRSGALRTSSPLGPSLAFCACASSPASSPPAASTWATTSARSASTSRARTAATRSTASSTCTRSTVPYDPAELRERVHDTRRSCSPPAWTPTAASSSAKPTCGAHRAVLAAVLGDGARRAQPDAPIPRQVRRPARAGLRRACSSTPCCRPPTSWPTAPTRCPSARTSASTSS